MTSTPSTMAVPATSTRDQWMAPTLALVTFLSSLASFALGPFLPIIARDLTVSVALLGQLPAASALVAAGLGLVAGPLADQRGFRRALLVALGCLAASAIGTGLASGFGLLLLAFLVGAVSRAAATPAAQAVISARFTGDARRRAMSWLTAGVSSAMVAGVPLLTAIDAGFGWRAAYAGLALLAVGGAFLVWRVIPADGPPSAAPPRLRTVLAAYTPIARHSATRVLIAAQVCGLAGTTTLLVYLGVFLAERYGFTTPAIGAVYLATGVGALVGSAAAGSRLGNLPLRALLGGTRLIIGLASAAVFGLPLPAALTIGLLVLCVALMAVANVAAPTLLAEVTPGGRATTMALNTAAASLGNAFGASLGGLALAVGGFVGLGVAAILWYAASAGLVWWSRSRRVTTAAADYAPAGQVAR